MLSRIAESLFWVGRYLERADDTARLLDVETHRMLEGSLGHDLPVSRALVSVMGLSQGLERDPNFAEVVEHLAFTTSQPSSIAFSLAHARESARGIRETVPSELWECLNATHVALAARVAQAHESGPHGFFRFAHFVRERVAIATGTIDATMTRDDGWRFLVLGRSIERIDMTARLLGVRLSEPERLSDWITTLRCCSAYEAFLRTYRGRVSATRTVEFLLLDRHCPRSAYFALAMASNCLNELDTEGARLGAVGEAQRLLGHARASFEYQSISELAPELAARLVELRRTCSAADLAIARRYFHKDATRVWRCDGEPLELSAVSA